jgi:hypothetical protein
VGSSSPDSANASTTTAACGAGVHSDRAHRSSECDIVRFLDAREAGEIAVAVAGQGRGGAQEKMRWRGVARRAAGACRSTGAAYGGSCFK